MAPLPDGGAAARAATETPTLCFRGGGPGGRQVALPPGQSIVGRDETTDIVIPADDARYVSRRHARISREPGGAVIEDLGSANGTWVNGQRIERASLSGGDVIQFGRHGPIAQFVADLPPTGRSVSPRLVKAAEAPSSRLRRAVSAAMASNARRDRRQLLLAATSAVLATTVLVAVLIRSGWLTTASDDRFTRLAAAYEGQVALIEVGVTQGNSYFSLGVGSGFLASDDGLVVTNKHVVQPQLFTESVACALASFERFGRPAPEITLWPGGTRFRPGASGAGDRTLGYSTAAGTLALVATSEDSLLPASEITCTSPRDGRPFTMPWRRHAADNNDLAVLRVSLSRRVPAIPLSKREVSAGETVMVYGFPSGFGPLEGPVAEPIFRVGKVLRVRETIQTDVVVLHGNSGGPLIDEAGEVVGVATRGPAESLNSAIKVEHVERLISAARKREHALAATIQ